MNEVIEKEKMTPMKMKLNPDSSILSNNKNSLIKIASSSPSFKKLLGKIQTK
jgi:hypothetical protein